jgi:hypothetical protein
LLKKIRENSDYCKKGEVTQPQCVLQFVKVNGFLNNVILT